MLYCDDKAASNIAHNPIQPDRTKHVEVDTNFINEMLDKSIICIPFVESQNQLANILTKRLRTISFNSFSLLLHTRRA